MRLHKRTSHRLLGLILGPSAASSNAGLKGAPEWIFPTRNQCLAPSTFVAQHYGDNIPLSSLIISEIIPSILYLFYQPFDGGGLKCITSFNQFSSSCFSMPGTLPCNVKTS